jgi:uncharacterized protein
MRIFLTRAPFVAAFVAVVLSSACAPRPPLQTPLHTAAVLQELDEREVFVLRYGGEPYAVETVSRTHGRLTGLVAVSEALEVMYEIHVMPDEAASRVEWTFQRPDRPPATPSVVHFENSGDHLSSDDEPAPRGKAAALPWFDQSGGMMEQLVRHAGTTGSDRVEVPLYRLIGGSMIPAMVTFPADRQVVIEVGGKIWRFALDAEGAVVEGQATAYGVTLAKHAELPREVRPVWPPYGTPPGAPYEALEVRIPSPEGHQLAGTLTLPDSGTRRPVAVLITGAAQHNRNNGTPPVVPFREIADALSSRGIAVLRLDDRGVGESTGDATGSTTQDETRDIHTALAWLRMHPAIDPERMALVGWSEGGLIAPIVAATEPGIAAIVIMNGPPTGRSTAEYQIRYSVERNPAVAADEKEQAITRLLESAQAHPRSASIIATDARPHAGRVAAPVLILNGANDRHVPPWSAAEYAAAFREGGNDDVTTRLFLGLNHNFLPDPDGSAAGWPFLPSTRLAPEVVSTLTEWLVSRLDAEQRDTREP